jgi:hypothetical protein
MRWTSLKTAMAGKVQGVNVLQSGPPGTAETELSKVIAQVLLKGSQHSTLLFDRVGKVLPPISSEAAQYGALWPFTRASQQVGQWQGLGESDP